MTARWLKPAAAALLGLVVGAGTALALQRLPEPPPRPPRQGRRGAGHTRLTRLGGHAGTPPSDPGAPESRVAQRRGAVVRLSTPPGPGGPGAAGLDPGRLPGGLAARVGRVRGVRAVTVVKGGLVGLTGSVDADGRPVDRPRPGTTVPLEAIGFDPATYPALLPASARAAFTRLRPGEALLGATSARLRRLGPGGRLRLAGGPPRRSPPDPPGDHPGGPPTPRVRTDGPVADRRRGGGRHPGRGGRGRGHHDRGQGGRDHQGPLPAARLPRRAAAAAGAVRRALPPRPRRLRGPGETPFFRAGDAVLPQAMVKERFGEFAWRKGAADAYAQDPAWRAANLATAQVPILGRVHCNRALIPALAGAMGELRQRGLARLVDPEAYRGCWNPRLTRSGSGVSRHAWGRQSTSTWPATRPASPRLRTRAWSRSWSAGGSPGAAAGWSPTRPTSSGCAAP